MVLVNENETAQLYQRFMTTGIPIARNARQMGIDPSLLSRKLNGKRPITRIEYDACSLLLEKQVAMTYSRLINGGAPSSVSIDDTEVHQTNDT